MVTDPIEEIGWSDREWLAAHGFDPRGSIDDATDELARATIAAAAAAHRR